MKRSLYLLLLIASVVCLHGCEDSGTTESSELGKFDSDDVAQGRLIYDGGCNTCHGIGAADAPGISDTLAWAEFAAKGIDTLVNNVKIGINGHPPKGLCLGCTDTDLKIAIIYMISESQ